MQQLRNVMIAGCGFVYSCISAVVAVLAAAKRPPSAVVCGLHLWACEVSGVVQKEFVTLRQVVYTLVHSQCSCTCLQEGLYKVALVKRRYVHACST